MTLTREIRDRRVAVAEDVLLQLRRLDVPLLVLRGVGYIVGAGHVGSSEYEGIDLDGDLKDHADMVQRRCTVCAMGALLLSKARLLDEVPMAAIVRTHDEIGEIDVDREDAVRLLKDTFDADTLNRVEAFFEGSPMHMFTRRYYLSGMDAYAKSLATPRERMIEVAENIVHNLGEFIVPARYLSDELSENIVRNLGDFLVPVQLLNDAKGKDSD